MAAPSSRRPSGSSLPGGRPGGGPSSLPDGDVRLGVETWLAAQGAPPPAPEDTETLGPEADQEAVARKILLDQLTGRARSRAELAAALSKKGVPQDLAGRMLDRFEDVGLVDDGAFARSWVEARQSGKGLARRALAQELRRKGVEDDVAREVLDEVDPETEVETARLLVRRKLRSVARLDRDTAVRRLSGMLARKGYPPSVAFRVVGEELESAGLDGSDVVEPFD